MREWLLDTGSDSCASALRTVLSCTAPFPSILDGLLTLEPYSGDSQSQATSNLNTASGLTPVVARRLWAQLALGCRQETSVDQLIAPLRNLGSELFFAASCTAARTPKVSAQRIFDLVGATDPNDKSGPAGIGASHAILPATPLPYTIRFENLDTATAPAKDVVITDRLDPATMDLSTFSFGSMAFGDVKVPVPWGRQSFETRLDLRPRTDLLLQISASLDRTTGVVTWRMHTLDPVTGLRPTDPLRGFLPPNVNSPEGEGQVTFTVMPRAGLENQTTIRNTSSIVFDFNDPIDTPEWSNVVDSAPPVLSVIVSPSANANGWNNTPVSVDFSCSDALSGVGVEPVDVVLNAEGTQQTASASCLDGLGHSASAAVGGINIDRTGPVITITQPANGASFFLNQPTAASYACSDATSGLASCVGPVSPGASLNTATVGARTFTVDATDLAGNRTSTTHRYTVGYVFDGFLSPLNNLPTTNRGAAGRTFPVKWILRDGNGAFVSDPAAISGIAAVPAACGAAATDVTGDDTTLGIDGLRYDALTGTWIFNWHTQKSQVGCWSLEVRMADDSVHRLAFELR